MDVAVDDVILTPAHDPPETLPEFPWIRAFRATINPASKPFCFGGMQPGLGAKRAKIELESVAVNIPQKVEQPHLNSSRVQTAQHMQDS